MSRESKKLTAELSHFSPPTTITADTIRGFFEALDTPVSLANWIKFREGEHQQLVESSIDPADYTDAEKFRRDYAACEFLSKATFLSLSANPSVIAKAKFRKAESRCAETNRNLEAWSSMGRHPPGVAAALLALQFKIQRYLGRFDPKEWVECCNWGPGANVGIPRRQATGYTKFGPRPTVTQECLDFCSPWFSEAFPLWATSIGGLTSARVVKGNRLQTVPKNAKTDRVILVEPSLNLFFQKGVGTMLKRRLAAGGNPINSQRRNQLLSRKALDLGLATVDFSAASDTISRVLIERILPQDWLTVMSAFRSESGTDDGEHVGPWEKYSTMGNGFTFELETLIFRCLAEHVCDVLGLRYDHVSVFGDDVIIPSKGLVLYSELSSALGFTVNTEKTWGDGVFRESCGAHWFSGCNVKPIYLRSPIESVADVVRHLNRLRLFASRGMEGIGCDVRYRRVWVDSFMRVPRSLREKLRGPLHLGDSVIWENLDHVRPAAKIEQSTFYGWRGFILVNRGESKEVNGHPLLTLRLFEGLTPLEDTEWGQDGLEPEHIDLGNKIPVLGAQSYQVRPVKDPIAFWHSPGPWLG